MLEVQGLCAWHGAAQALFGVDLVVAHGELVVLQGLNGAGKSTLLLSLMGLVTRTRGSVCFEGQALEGWPPHRRARAGLGFVPEDRRLFPDLTVQQTLQLVARGPASQLRQRTDQVFDLFPPLRPLMHRQAGWMSGGEQQMLAIGRALMTGPRLLLLDEPCEGIAPVLVQALAEALMQLKAQGLTLLVAEQNHVLADRADRRLTLQAGQVLHTTT